jgi:hypothetical protein
MFHVEQYASLWKEIKTPLPAGLFDVPRETFQSSHEFVQGVSFHVEQGRKNWKEAAGFITGDVCVCSTCNGSLQAELES